MTSATSSWFFKKGYLQGVFWILMVSLVSNMNDILMRMTGQRLDPMEVAFFRFFFSMIILLPVMMKTGRSAFTTNRPALHFIRVLLGFFAVACWCYGLAQSPLAVASTLAQTVPLFVLPMAALFLGENVGWQRTLATLAGFCGILFVMIPDGSTAALLELDTQQVGVIFLLTAALLFAVSDILNKIMVATESSHTMLFYFALGTTIAGIIPAYMVWQTPNMTELCFLFALGAGANLILYCLLKAFAATDVSALAPYRYVEMLSAGVFGYLLFQEIPTMYTLIGASIIVPSTLAIAYYETHQKKQQKRAEDDAATALKKGQQSSENTSKEAA
ncbi:DMT family transporter [Alphaproteobacteria bacterium]|nr:DMT family transporter [Alphaproteobacteria bacterium]